MCNYVVYWGWIVLISWWELTIKYLSNIKNAKHCEKEFIKENREWRVIYMKYLISYSFLLSSDLINQIYVFVPVIYWYGRFCLLLLSHHSPISNCIDIVTFSRYQPVPSVSLNITTFTLCFLVSVISCSWTPSGNLPVRN